MDLALDRFKHPTRRLARVLAPLRYEYEYIFLDCPPSISLVSESVFEAADTLIVPIIPATLSSRTFDTLSELVHGGPQVLGFFSMVDTRKSLHHDVMAEVRATFPGTMLGAAVPTSEEIERMGVERDVVAAFAPDCPGAIAYRTLWLDVRQRLGQRMVPVNTLPGRS